ncbi:MAG: hypothetical protein RLZZ621_2275 [Gemmatimonadota bacterium]
MRACPNKTTLFELMTEIEQKPNREIRRPEIVQELCFVCTDEAINRLQFDEDLLLHEQISTEVADDLAMKMHLQGCLASDSETSCRNCLSHGTEIHRFEKSPTKGVIDVS